MKRIGLVAGAALLAFAIPGVAHAQIGAATGAHPFAGVQVGHHDLGLDLDEVDTGDFDVDDSGLIYGVYGGVDFDTGPAMVVGIEGNFNLGSGPIDSDFGIAGRVGVRAGAGTVIFARAGYQWVNVSAEGLLDLDEGVIDDDDLDIDDTVGDYLVGVGADFAVGGNMGIRAAVDTIAFDSIRPTLGVHFRF
jgi:opacity protein-like surface antigen